MNKRTAFAGVMLAIISVASCESPLGPCEDPFGRGDNLANQILLTCSASGSNAQCTARPSYGLYDKCPEPLGSISWTSSNPSIASISSSGFVTALAPGEVDITARSGGLVSEVWSALVDPQQSPRPFRSLSGSVRENDGSNTAIPGVVVEIVDGYNAGASDTSNTGGFYLIERVVTGFTVTVRASKSGYITTTTTGLFEGPGISSPFHDLRLTRATP
jgi:hypothetical protein